MSKKPLISVIICTFDRPALLGRCLKGLQDQAGVSDEIEVIVVENALTNTSQEVVNLFAERGLAVRYVRETQPGLSVARNRGLCQAKGAYVAYIDDDAVPYPDWLFRMKNFISQVPNAAAFGGPYDGYTLVSLPSWFPPNYGSWELGPEIRRLEIGREWLNGTNMVFRKEALAAIGGFDARLGMRKRTIAFGEETKALLELTRLCLPIYYVPEMRVRHLIAEYKMSLRWLLSAAYAVGRCTKATFGNRRSVGGALAAFIASGIGAVMKMATLPSMPVKRRLYYSFVDMWREAGAVVETLNVLKGG